MTDHEWKRYIDSLAPRHRPGILWPDKARWEQRSPEPAWSEFLAGLALGGTIAFMFFGWALWAV